MKILMCAPFDTNGRFRGGVTELVCGIIAAREERDRIGLSIDKLETCRISRPANSNGRLNIANFRNYLACRSAAARAIRAEDYDAVYYHTSMRMGLLKDLMILRHMRKKKRVHAVLHIHFAEIDCILPRQKPLRRLALRLLHTVTDRIVLLSERTREQFIAAGFSPERLTVLYNFDTLRYSEQEISDKAARALRGDPLRLLFVGSLCSRKGVPDLLSALSLAKTPYHIELCGSPTDDEVGRACLAAEAASEGRVSLVGYVMGSEKKDAYSRADVLVLPSYEEGMPVVLLEAYAAGCAVIATPIAAVPEIVSEKNGILVPPGDPATLAAAIDALGTDRARLSAMMLANRRAAQTYTPAHFLNRLMDVLTP